MKIGDKVVCVDDSPCRACCERLPIIYNQVYVIQAFSPNSDDDGMYGLKCLGLNAYHNCCGGNNIQDGWLATNRFRLLDELKQQTKQRNQNGQTSQEEHQSPSYNPSR